MAVSISGEGAISGSSSYSFDSSVSIAGTTTIEDVTSVDSIGIITAQSGVNVTGGTVIVGADPNDGSNPGCKMTTTGVIQAARASGSAASAVFMGFLEGDTSANFRVNANGSGYLMGGVGIGTDNPQEDLHVYKANSSTAIKVETTGSTAAATLQLKGGSGRVDFGVPGGSGNRGRILYANAANTLTGAPGDRMEFFTNNDTSNSAILITSDNKIGIGSDIPAQALDVVGRISKTEYEPGELIECIETIANGINVTVGSGTYSPTNVTATQGLSNSYADINGSVITYNVPAGTKRLVYDFWVYMRDKDVGPILHFKGLTTPDGSSTYTTVNDSRHTWRGPTANADFQIWIHNRMVLFDNSIDEEDLGAGKLYPLGGTTRKMKFQCREYSGSYEAELHKTQHWDGGGTDILVRPQIRIAAYA